MRTPLQPGPRFPDLALPDHHGCTVKSVRVPAAYWAGHTDTPDWNIVGRGKGRVRWVTAEYGFINCEWGEEIFFHFTVQARGYGCYLGEQQWNSALSKVPTDGTLYTCV